VRRRGDIVAIALIWLCVLVGAILVAPSTDDAAGVGELAAAVGFVLTGLYLYVRRLRHSGRLIRTPARPGSITVAWLKAVLAILLWLAGSAIGILVGMHDALALCFGATFPLGIFLVRRYRRHAGRK
jgi:hypothetical protein